MPPQKGSSGGLTTQWVVEAKAQTTDLVNTLNSVRGALNEIHTKLQALQQQKITLDLDVNIPTELPQIGGRGGRGTSPLVDAQKYFENLERLLQRDAQKIKQTSADIDKNIRIYPRLARRPPRILMPGPNSFSVTPRRRSKAWISLIGPFTRC